MGGKKASSPRKQKPAFVSAEPLEERGSSELGVFSTCTCSLLVAVLVGVLAVFVASNNAVGGLEEGCVDSTSGYAIPEVFGHLYTINKVPYHQLLVGDNFNYADGSSVPALPDNAFKNPHDIIPALAKAVLDHNVVVSVQLVELLLDEKKVSPATATIATSKQVGYGFGQAGLHVNPNAKTTVTAKSSSAYARLLWKASEPFYFETNEQLVNLRVVLLHKFFDITFDSRSQSSNSDKRRAVDMLGLALESRNLSGDQNKMGDIDAAWKLYNGAVALGLWGLPDQRPQHYFPFLEPGDPFPSTDLYRGAVDLLESNWSTIRRELIQHRKFPGKMDIDREHLASGGGRWLQADFLFHNKFDGDNSAKFPQTADILKQIYEEYAKDLPDAIMQMSTMTKVRSSYILSVRTT